jgi:DNA-binding NtrC family response regulator
MLPNASVSTPAASAVLPVATPRSRSRLVLIASSDPSLRERLRQSLSGLRWQVLEARAGAQAWLATEAEPQLEALLIDSWLPDLDVPEFLADFHREHPQVDLMMTDGTAVGGSPRSPYHQELLYALRRSQEGDTAAWRTAPMLDGMGEIGNLPTIPLPASGVSPAMRERQAQDSRFSRTLQQAAGGESGGEQTREFAGGREASARPGVDSARPPLELASKAMQRPERNSGRAAERVPERIPELVGDSPAMLEVSRRIRLVAARTTPVLIEGPTGSGKELVAEALHRLSSRSRKPFVAINCAAIPEALLEAELFGHTRGAFTGAVQGRTGRIESADGGTLFLDEIGEMPLALQSKLLRFFESGELQRIGDNETVKVDVRIVAATHQPLAEDAQKGVFRADLYYRLAVFLIRTPALVEHMEDLPLLVAHFLERMGRKSPVKRIAPGAMQRLTDHGWPGNVRELEHVLERASILAGDDAVITAGEIDFGLSLMN